MSATVQDAFVPFMVCLDIDGTIVHEDNHLSDRVRSAVRAVVQAGHVVVLATGRSEAGTVDTAGRLGIEPPFLVSANGALVFEAVEGGYRREKVETFDPGPVLERIRAGLSSGSYMVEDAEGRRRYTEGMVDWNLEDAELVELDDLAAGEVTRIVVMSPDQRVEEFLETVEQMGLHQVSYSVGFSSWLDIAPDGVHKATGLERVRGALGVARDRVIVVGDGRNDIEMFRWAREGGGRAVAMGQAPPELVAVATESTANVEADGLALVLEELVA